MTHNLFDNAKLGDMFLTTENKQAVFLRFAENSEHKFAILYIEGWGNVQVFRHNGKEVFNDAAHSIIGKQKDQVITDAIKWRTDKPQGDIIVAKIAESFCYKKDCYEVLHFISNPYPHYYDAWCEEVPYSAIEKWCLIK